MPLIDTLALKTDLLDGGMPGAQAMAIVKALAEADTGQLATKTDVKALDMKVNILLAFHTPLLFAVLAILWRLFFAGMN